MSNSKCDKRIAYPDHVLDVGSASVLFEELRRTRSWVDFPDEEKSVIGSSKRCKILCVCRPSNAIDAKGMLAN